MSHSVRISPRPLRLECPDKAGRRIQKVAGQLVVVAHVDGVDERIVAVRRREAAQPDIHVAKRDPIAGLAAVARIAKFSSPRAGHTSKRPHSRVCRQRFPTDSGHDRLPNETGCRYSLSSEHSPTSVRHHRTRAAERRHMHKHPEWPADREQPCPDRRPT